MSSFLNLEIVLLLPVFVVAIFVTVVLLYIKTWNLNISRARRGSRKLPLGQTNVTLLVAKNKNYNIPQNLHKSCDVCRIFV